MTTDMTRKISTGGGIIGADLTKVINHNCSQFFDDINDLMLQHLLLLWDLFNPFPFAGSGAEREQQLDARRNQDAAARQPLYTVSKDGHMSS